MLIDALAPEDLVARIAQDDAYVRAVPFSVDHGRHQSKSSLSAFFHTCRKLQTHDARKAGFPPCFN
jgi:hypothetical protein